jgi:hypothetical protein
MPKEIAQQKSKKWRGGGAILPSRPGGNDEQVGNHSPQKICAQNRVAITTLCRRADYQIDRRLRPSQAHLRDEPGWAERNLDDIDLIEHPMLATNDQILPLRR